MNPHPVYNPVDELLSEIAEKDRQIRRLRSNLSSVRDSRRRWKEKATQAGATFRAVRVGLPVYEVLTKEIAERDGLL